MKAIFDLGDDIPMNSLYEFDGVVFLRYYRDGERYEKAFKKFYIISDESKNLTTAKKLISEHIEDAKHGLFNSRNLVGDELENIYSQDGLYIDICKEWEYFEVFGLNDEEFEKLHNYYNRLRAQYGV